MGLIQEKPAVGVVIVVVALLVVGYVMFGRGAGSAEPGSRFYYDVTSGELVAFKASQMPPVTLPNGNQGVMAHVFACGDCASSEQFVGYLNKYTDAYIKEATREVDATSGPVTPPMSGDLVAKKPDGTGEPQWFEMSSQQGSQIVRDARAKCGDGKGHNAVRAVECLPQ